MTGFTQPAQVVRRGDLPYPAGSTGLRQDMRGKELN
ncbi:hypothetical protein DES43_12631 [Aquamicrobium defluvii]|uniref:Uncharacterized protein n=1 Tax=Aquamicrobium defluvii TaxID=69279 RepID=A0A4R6YAS9_9HYPH|nr:hypothetical protein DES43_12631 [Aquamicrobium defluvii]